MLELAKRLGWRSACFRPAQVRPGKFVTPVGGDGAGWPDLALVRRNRMIFAELKTDEGYRKPRQRAWHVALEQAGQTVYTWKPRDWLSGEIERTLT